MSAPPPQNVDAEESVLGAMMLSKGAIAPVSAILGDGSAFYFGKHTAIYRAALALDARGVPVDAVTLVDELERRGELEQVGGRVRIHELAAMVSAASNASHYARIIRDKAQQRELIRTGSELCRIGFEGPSLNGHLQDELGRAQAAIAALRTPTDDTDTCHGRVLDGARFVFAESAEVPAIVGRGGIVVQAAGEPLCYVGPDGVGKTAVMQQHMLARIGLRAGHLGLDVEPAEGKQLYIAADRPRQAARSLRRMVNEEEHADVLRDRVIVWRGPLPFDLTESPRKLAEFALALGASDVYIDDLKSVALDLSKDETGARIALAFQEVIAEGIELVAGHHQRKEQQGAGKPKRLADVYGSRWITATMGSVVLLWGEPGDLVIDLVHLKQPAEEYGPCKLVHDHARGVTKIFEGVDLEHALLNYPDGMTVGDAARLLFDVSARPSANETEKARRRLNALAKDGKAERRDDRDGLARYYLRDPRA